MNSVDIISGIIVFLLNVLVLFFAWKYIKKTYPEFKFKDILKSEKTQQPEAKMLPNEKITDSLIKKHEGYMCLGFVIGLVIAFISILMIHKNIPSFPNSDGDWKYMFATCVLLITIFLITTFLPKGRMLAFLSQLFIMPIIISLGMGIMNLSSSKLNLQKTTVTCKSDNKAIIKECNK